MYKIKAKHDPIENITYKYFLDSKPEQIPAFVSAVQCVYKKDKVLV